MYLEDKLRKVVANQVNNGKVATKVKEAVDALKKSPTS